MPIRNVAPTLGEHNEDVLARVLGLDAKQIADLEQRGITGKTAKPRRSRQAP
jgi:crotonobetainyl-CoA:carnitine CoA-transferase CaiB-like acyl-CoA transferase